MKKYIARIERRWGCEAKIREVEVEKETTASVWVDGSRCAKMSTYRSYFDTWEGAREALLTCQQDHVDSLRSRLERAKGHLGNIKGMKQ